MRQFASKRTFLALFTLCTITIVLAGCGADADNSSEEYRVATCSFESTDGDCEPITVPGTPAESFDGEFSLINPADTDSPTCTGTLSLSVNGRTSSEGMMAWHATELSPDTCEPIDSDIEGSRELGDEITEDVYFPTGDFTFRILVERTSG